MLTEKIYMRDARGAIRSWQGEAVGGQWRAHTGIDGAAVITSDWSAAPARSKATDVEQAIFEMEAQRTKLLSKDYRLTIELVDIPRGSFIKPMLAHTYKQFPGVGFAQPKLDGMRCLANVDGAWSRGAKPILTVPHIIKKLKRIFDKYPWIVFDGEIYNHDYCDNFNGLMSLAKKTRPSQSDLDESEKFLQYHVYDCFNLKYPSMSFSERHNFLYSVLFPEIEFVKFVDACSVDNDMQFKEYHIEFIFDGYEGSIFRTNGPYEQKRSNMLLKNKDFITEEFKLTGYEEGKGNWSGYAKRVLCETSEGVEFGAGIRGSQSFCKELLATDPKTFESVTIRHFGRTPDGSIRHGVAISFNDKGGLENRRINDGEVSRTRLDANSTEDEF